MITVFTPSFADENDTNAQNLTVKEVVARLSPDKFRVRMFCEGVPDPRISGRPNTELLQWTRRANTPRMLVKFLSRVPDVYFFPREGPFDSAVFACKKHLRLRTAIVTYIVSGGLQQGISRKTMLRNVYNADVVVANSKYLSQIVGGTVKADGRATEVATIYDGADERYYHSAKEKQPGRVSGKKLVVLSAGSFRSYKRMNIVIEQAARWPTVAFRIAGQGEEEQSCRGLAHRLGCRNVSFLGHVSQQALGDEMRGADIFFFPSEVEGHPQVLAQAAACGLPCVARDIYRPEFVLDGVTGFLAGSDEELSTKLDLLIKDGDLRNSMASAATTHMRAFSWERAAHDWEQVFEQAVQRRQAPVPY